MHTIILAIDCWHNMSTQQVRGIARLSGDLLLHQDSVPRLRHPLMPAWPMTTRARLLPLLGDHTRVVYVGQWFTQCLWRNPELPEHLDLGMAWMTQQRTHVEIRPSLCRTHATLPAPWSPRTPDRAMTARDLGGDWRQLEPDLYRLTRTR